MCESVIILKPKSADAAKVAAHVRNELILMAAIFANLEASEQYWDVEQSSKYCRDESSSARRASFSSRRPACDRLPLFVFY
jgi:hypothetical protein